MLDLVKPETERIDSRFLEPACGSGNFLVPVLERKLAAVQLRHGRSDFEKKHYALFALMWWFARKPRPVGQISAVFLMGYGTFRFLVEFTRQPDAFLGLLFDGLSMGQLLSLPMIVVGAIIFVWSAKRSNRAPKP